MQDKQRSDLLILSLLEQAFESVRQDKGIPPLFPYDKKTGKVQLPAEIEEKLRDLVFAGEKAKAVKQVAYLTGAGLRISKDYVDSLIPSRQKAKRKHT